MNDIFYFIKDKPDIYKYFNKDCVSIDEMHNKILDFGCEIERLYEKINDIIQDRDDNYRPLPRSEYTGSTEDDRY